MVQVVACYHPDLGGCNDVMDLRGGKQRSWGQALGEKYGHQQKGRCGKDSRTAYQTDVGVNAHLDVFPVKLNAPSSNPEGDAAEESKGRGFLVPRHP